MAGEERHLDAQPRHQRQGDEELGALGYAGPVAPGEHLEVGGAGRGDQRQDADEHERRAEGGVEDEPAPGVGSRRGPVGVAEAGDEHPHRHQHDLEGDEEEDGVAGVERGERPGLDQQQARVEDRRRAALRTPVRRVHDHRDPQHGGHHEQGRADAVDGELPAQVERGHPRPVDGGAGQHGAEHGGQRDRAGRERDPVDRAVRERAAGAEQPHRGGGRKDQAEGDHHSATPAAATATHAGHDPDQRGRGALGPVGALAAPPREHGRRGAPPHVGVDHVAVEEHHEPGQGQHGPGDGAHVDPVGAEAAVEQGRPVADQALGGVGAPRGGPDGEGGADDQQHRDQRHPPGDVPAQVEPRREDDEAADDGEACQQADRGLDRGGGPVGVVALGRGGGEVVEDEPGAHAVGRGQRHGDQERDEHEDRAGLALEGADLGRREDVLLADEPHQRRHAGQREQADEHRRPDEQVPPQAAAHREGRGAADRDAEPADHEEEQRLEEGVRVEVEQTRARPLLRRARPRAPRA